MSSKQTFKNVIAIIIAIVVSYLLIKVLFTLLGWAIKATISLIFIIAIVLLAVPVYAFIKAKIFK